MTALELLDYLMAMDRDGINMSSVSLHFYDRGFFTINRVEFDEDEWILVASTDD